MRFLGLGLARYGAGRQYDWTFREALTRAKSPESRRSKSVQSFYATLAAAEFLAMGGKIIDASIVARAEAAATPMTKNAPSRKGVPRRNGRRSRPAVAPDDGPRCPLDGQSSPRPSRAGMAHRASILRSRPLSIRTTSAIDRWHGLIRRWTVTDAADATNGTSACPELIDRDNYRSEVATPIAQRPMRKHLADRLLRSQIPPQEAKGQADAAAYRPSPTTESQGARRRRACLRPGKRARWAYSSRTIGIARARTKISLRQISSTT